MFCACCWWPSSDLERHWVKYVFLSFPWALSTLPCYFMTRIAQNAKISVSIEVETTGLNSPIYLVFLDSLFPMCMYVLHMYVCMCMDSHVCNSVFMCVWRPDVDTDYLQPLSTSYIDTRSLICAQSSLMWLTELASLLQRYFVLSPYSGIIGRT